MPTSIPCGAGLCKSTDKWNSTVNIFAREIKELLQGNGARPKILLEKFSKHNEQCRSLVGTEYCPSTIYRFDRVVRYLGDFMQSFYRIEDIPLREINHEFITNFDYYLKTEKLCGHNAVVKLLKCFKKFIRIAIKNDWISTTVHIVQAPGISARTCACGGDAARS